MVLEGVGVIPVFFRFYRNFSQEFLGDRNSCIYSGFFPPKAAGSGQRQKMAFYEVKYGLK